MNLFKILSPQSWIGKIALWGLFFASGYAVALKTSDPCPPTTAIQIDQKNKAKKGSNVSNDLSAIINQGSKEDCSEWLKSLSMKEIRQIRK